MKEERILDALGKVDEKYIKEADPEVKAKRKAPVWTKWAAMAACLCLIVVGAVTIPMFNQDSNDNNDPPNSDDYPYNDGEVLDYIGMPLDDIHTEAGTIIFNEITNIEAYRKFNTYYGYEDTPYYSTRTSAYDYLTWYPVSGENDFINVDIFEKDGSIEDCPNFDEFQQFKYKAPIAADLIMQIFEKGDTSHANAYYNGNIDASGISFNPESNCIATVVIGKNIASIDARFKDILPIFQSTLGTENSSYIEGQEISVHYFYQNRLFRDSETEEAFQYYVYYERDGLQYLYQFSSNWSLIGQDVSAIHNPPHTLHYVETQDECRGLFVDYLLTIMSE